MELKNYQKLVLKDVDAYHDALMKTDGINAAWKEYWASKGIGGDLPPTAMISAVRLTCA